MCIFCTVPGTLEACNERLHLFLELSHILSWIYSAENVPFHQPQDIGLQLQRIEHVNIVTILFIKSEGDQTSSPAFLVIQRLRICLPMQGTQVQSPVREDPTCCKANNPEHCNYGSLCASSLWSTTGSPK